MGEELRDDEREIFSKLTGRDREPLRRVDQFAAVIGRRGGKSRAVATLATYIAGLCEHSDALVPGERGVLLCVALDQRVAKIILDYAEASFQRSPILKQLIASRTADALELTNGIRWRSARRHSASCVAPRTSPSSPTSWPSGTLTQATPTPTSKS
jgi:hypothetical protein